MVKIIDRRKSAIGGHSKRSVNRIKNIAIHYSATKEGSTSAFEQFWGKSRGWVTGGYHEVVLLNGNIELNYDSTVIANGIKNYNISTYHICYVGDKKPNEKQLISLRKRVKRAKVFYKVLDKNIKGHREFKGADTSCPAVNVRESIVNHIGSNIINNIINTAMPKPNPNVLGHTARIQRKLNTYNFNNITVDDKYGLETHKALTKMYQYELNKQFNRKLVVDGIPGSKTDGAAVTIKKGARGNLTYAMQAFLFFKGYFLSVDGIYGDITDEMIRRFQRDNHLSVDGIASEKTFHYLTRRK